MCLCPEFDKNANSIGINTAMLVILISLATIGVCVFCAVTSVAALFIFGGKVMKTVRSVILIVLVVLVSFYVASCASQGVGETAEIETASVDATIASTPEIVELPNISMEMRLSMPEIKSDIRVKMGTLFTTDFEQEVDTFMAILKTAHDDCLADGDISRYIRVADMANSKYKYLIEELDDAIGIPDVDEIIFILNSGLLTATATLAINSALDETEKFEQWEFLEEMIQEYSMLFYDTDILA